jgi:hypothetical protein
MMSTCDAEGWLKIHAGETEARHLAHAELVKQFPEEWLTMWHTTGRSQRLHGHVLWMANRLVKHGQAASRAGDKKRSLDLQIALQPGLARC